MRNLFIFVLLWGPFWSRGLAEETPEDNTAPPGQNAQTNRESTTVPEENVSVGDKQIGRITLRATGAAPALAQGDAELRGFTLAVETQGLGPGAYRIEAVLRGDPVPILLGVVSIVNPSLSPDRLTSENFKEDSVTDATDILQSRSELPLPPRLDPHQIETVTVADHGGTALLQGETGKKMPGPPPGEEQPH
jgi:hypothetical protein